MMLNKKNWVLKEEQKKRYKKITQKIVELTSQTCYLDHKIEIINWKETEENHEVYFSKQTTTNDEIKKKKDINLC
jgi:hypothetical protein